MPRDAVSRTANVEHNGGHKWVKVYMYLRVSLKYLPFFFGSLVQVFVDDKFWRQVSDVYSESFILFICLKKKIYFLQLTLISCEFLSESTALFFPLIIWHFPLIVLHYYMTFSSHCMTLLYDIFLSLYDIIIWQFPLIVWHYYMTISSHFLEKVIHSQQSSQFVKS